MEKKLKFLVEQPKVIEPTLLSLTDGRKFAFSESVRKHEIELTERQAQDLNATSGYKLTKMVKSAKPKPVAPSE